MNPFTGTQYSLPDNPEIPQIMRRQKMAEQLLQQSQDPLQGQMVSGQFVAPSITQYLAKGLQAYMGRKGLTEADEKASELAKALRGQEQGDLQKFMELSQGRPGQTIDPTTAVDDEGNPMPSAQMPAQAPNMGAAYAALLNSQSPSLRQAGMQGMTQLPRLQAAQQEKEAERAFRMQQLQEQHNLRMQAMQEQNANRQQMAEEQRNFMLQMKQMGAQNAQPYFQPVQTAQGVMAFNARTGKVEPVQASGAPVVGAQFDPSLQGQLAGAKASGKTLGESQTQAQIDLPRVAAQGEETIKLVDDLLASPGFKQAVGTSRLMGIQNVPGTAAKDFDVRLDQLKGKQFLQAFQSLKGGGQITEVEGKKATDAISRMNAASSEKDFENAAREFQSIIRQGTDRARSKAGGAQPSSTPKRIRYDAQGNQIP